MTDTNMIPVAGWRVSAPTLQGRARQAPYLRAVSKRELVAGDEVIVTTQNSEYRIRALGEDLYLVAGGWFDRHGESPQAVSINGCTWGGTAIKLDIVAARGLCLEFGNSVVTTRIRSVRMIPAAERSAARPC